MFHILGHTKEKISQKIFSKFTKGKRHASLIYSQWMKEGNLEIEKYTERQALKLVQEIFQITDFSLPAVIHIM